MKKVIFKQVDKILNIKTSKMLKNEKKTIT